MLSDILSGISSAILSDIHLTYLLTFPLEVEVRQGTLAGDGRG